jgi:hypothetical protein
MINTLVMVGVIERVHVSESKKGNASGSILLRYGDDRNYSGGAVEFINGVLIRIPPYRLNAIRDRLKEGSFVHVVGHVQGVLKQQAGQGIIDVELVADRIDFVQGLNSVRNAYQKGRGKPGNGKGNAGGRHEEQVADSVLSEPAAGEPAGEQPASAEELEASAAA